jgi:hypothetical protein
MKIGKRRWEAKHEAKLSAAAAASRADPVPESWSVPASDADAEHPASVAPPTTDPASIPVPADEPDPADEIAASTPPPGDEQETIIEGEAVELPTTEVGAEQPAAPVFAPPEPAYEPPAPVAAMPSPRAPGEPLPPPGATWGPTPPSMPFPVAEEPVLVYSSAGAEAPAVTPLADAGEAYASGHAHAPGTSPSWPEPVMQMAAERPEVLVGAAFAGGLLFAMIVRRLGR